MRINPLEDGSLRSSNVKKKKKSKKSQKIGSGFQEGFIETLEEVQISDLERALQATIKEVVDLGNNLIRSPTTQNFHKYREAVKSFLKLIEKRLYIVDKNFSPQEGLYMVAREVDENLQQIAESLIDVEKSALNLSAKVETIYGLLMDLYR